MISYLLVLMLIVMKSLVSSICPFTSRVSADYSKPTVPTSASKYVDVFARHDVSEMVNSAVNWIECHTREILVLDCLFKVISVCINC